MIKLEVNGRRVDFVFVSRDAKLNGKVIYSLNRDQEIHNLIKPEDLFFGTAEQRADWLLEISQMYALLDPYLGISSGLYLSKSFSELTNHIISLDEKLVFGFRQDSRDQIVRDAKHLIEKLEQKI